MSSRFKIGDRDTLQGHAPDGTGWNFFFGRDQEKGEGDSIHDIEKIKPAKKSAAKKQDYKGNGKHEWEHVTKDGVVLRLRVPGGWLYKADLASPVFVPLPEVDKRPI